MKLKEIVAYAQKIAPFDTAGEWDNVGLLTGTEEAEITTALLALDITSQVVAEARQAGAELIISHHPVIFDPIRALAPDDPAYQLAKYDINALCLHTNLDRAQEGVNTALGRALGLNNTVLYPQDYLLIGNTDRAYTAAEYAAVIKEKLSAPSVRYTEGTVRRVAVSSGGGGEGVELAGQYGFDAFVTGELKHHQYLYAAAHHIAAFDAGHFSTEDVIIAPLRDMLAQQFPAVRFLISEVCACPYIAI